MEVVDKTDGDDNVECTLNCTTRSSHSFVVASSKDSCRFFLS